jgi:hypothetical protein
MRTHMVPVNRALRVTAITLVLGALVLQERQP